MGEIINLRERMLKKAVRPEETIQVEGVGDVLMIGLTVPEVTELLTNKPQGDNEAEIDTKSGARFIIKCAHDPATRQPIFDIADEATLLNLPALMFYDLRNAAQRMCGLRAKKDEVKNV